MLRPVDASLARWDPRSARSPSVKGEIVLRKGALIVFGVVVLAGLAALLLLNHYKIDMIHAAILNAVVQKAPSDYSRNRIEERFRSVYQQARDQGRVDAYLRRLLALAQRLEKIQHLNRSEVDELLENLDTDPAEEKTEEAKGAS